MKNVHLYKKIKNSKSKRAQSQIVETLLLILIVVVAVGLVGYFAINFIKKQQESGKCFDVRDQLEIKSHPKYTCYSDGADNTIPTDDDKVRVQVGVGKIDLING